MTYHKAVILLGSNLGERLNYLQAATEKIKLLGEIERQSQIYESESWGLLNQPLFLNQVVVLKTRLKALTLLENLLKIEGGLKRQRNQKWASRTIDLDLLYYDEVILKTETLTLPHPEILKRRFTLLPLCEILPYFVHPLVRQNHIELLKQCEDFLEVKILTT